MYTLNKIIYRKNYNINYLHFWLWILVYKICLYTFIQKREKGHTKACNLYSF